MKKKYFINANIVDPQNSIDEVGGLIINDSYDVDDNKNIPIPFERNILHFGGGQTEAVLSLPSGKYTLQLVIGDYEHMPIMPLGDNPIVSDKINIEILP